MELFIRSKNSLPSIFPRPDHFDFSIGGLSALNSFAIGSHDREQRFHSMNPVPEQIRMMRLQFTRTICLRVGHLPKRALPGFLRVFPEPERRRAEHWHPAPLRQSKNLL